MSESAPLVSSFASLDMHWRSVSRGRAEPPSMPYLVLLPLFSTVSRARPSRVMGSTNAALKVGGQHRKLTTSLGGCKPFPVPPEIPVLPWQDGPHVGGSLCGARVGAARGAGGDVLG
eukprot:6714513-Prymnesium_polylepis.1